MKLQKFDKATKARAEHTARILVNLPSEKESLFLVIANAYLDGLIIGQNLRFQESISETEKLATKGA